MFCFFTQTDVYPRDDLMRVVWRLLPPACMGMRTPERRQGQSNQGGAGRASLPNGRWSPTNCSALLLTLDKRCLSGHKNGEGGGMGSPSSSGLLNLLLFLLLLLFLSYDLLRANTDVLSPINSLIFLSSLLSVHDKNSFTQGNPRGEQ
eukprot:gene8849-6230_t